MTDGVDSFTEDICDHLETTKAVVLQGPPGTGKTYRAKQVAQSMGDDVYRWTQSDHHFDPDRVDDSSEGNGWKKEDLVWEMVQFHSGYTYEDFIRGISIDTDSDGGSSGFSDASFVSEDGILTQLATVAAHDDGPEKVVLVIDELNRGDVGSIFGEAILAIEADKRGDWPIRLKYDAPEGYDGGRTLTLPENLYIIGTMNTADESVALIDNAVRRRFRFIDVLPSEGVLHDYYKGEVPARVQRQITGLFVELSKQLDLDSEYAIGHSYFMHDEAEKRVFTRGEDENLIPGEKINRWKTDLLPLLKEYFEKGVPINNPAGYFDVETDSEDEFSVRSTLKDIEKGRNGYVVNINDYKEGSRNPEKWFEHGFVAGGQDRIKLDTNNKKINIGDQEYNIDPGCFNDDDEFVSYDKIDDRQIHIDVFEDIDTDKLSDSYVEGGDIDEESIDRSNSSLSAIENVAEQGDIVLPRWNQGDAGNKGAVAISVVTSDHAIECFDQSKVGIDRIFNNQSPNSYVKKKSTYEESNAIGLGEHYPDGVVRVNHLFSLPCISEICTYDNTKENTDDNINEKIGTQAIGGNKNNESKDRIPGNFEDDVIEYVTGGEHLHPRSTAGPLKSNYKRMMLFQIVSYFQKEYRFSPYDLPDKYLNDEGGLLRKYERQQQGMSTGHGPRNPELSVIEESNDKGTPHRTRVWIPVFSDPFAIRDDELLFDGENIYVISRIKENVHNLPNGDPDHLYPHRCEYDYSDEWENIGSEPVGKFLEERIIREINCIEDENNGLKLEALHRAVCFLYRNKNYIWDNSEDNEFAGYSNFDVYAKCYAKSLNANKWSYNNLPMQERIGGQLDAALPRINDIEPSHPDAFDNCIENILENIKPPLGSGDKPFEPLSDNTNSQVVNATKLRYGTLLSVEGVDEYPPTELTFEQIDVDGMKNALSGIQTLSFGENFTSILEEELDLQIATEDNEDDDNDDEDDDNDVQTYLEGLVNQEELERANLETTSLDNEGFCFEDIKKILSEVLEDRTGEVELNVRNKEDVLDEHTKNIPEHPFTTKELLRMELDYLTISGNESDMPDWFQNLPGGCND